MSHDDLQKLQLGKPHKSPQGWTMIPIQVGPTKVTIHGLEIIDNKMSPIVTEECQMLSIPMEQYTYEYDKKFQETLIKKLKDQGYIITPKKINTPAVFKIQKHFRLPTTTALQ